MNMDPGTWSIQVAAAVRTEMASRHQTAEALADVLGVAEPAVARRLLDGKTPFDLVEIERVAVWLGTTPSRLLARADGRVARGTPYPITPKGKESCTLSHPHHHESGS